MIAGDLSDLLLRSTVLLAMAWIATLAIERSGGSAAMRYAAWLLGFGALLLLPLLAALLPALPLPVLPAETPLPIAPAIESGAVTASVAEPWPLSAVLQLVYCCVAAALFARLVLGRLLLANIWKRARPIDEPEPLHLLGRLAQSLRLRRAVELRIADRPVVPMTWGTFRPKILLPADAVGWSGDRWHDVLLHELGHVARRDSAGRALAAALCAIYWPNPAAWLAAERMRREQEHACDDLVLAHGAEAAGYARNLLVAARNQQGWGNFNRLAAAIVRRSDLERRLTAIVGNVPRRRAGGAFVTAGSLIALAAASATAAIVPVAASGAPSAGHAIAPVAQPAPAPVALAPVTRTVPAASAAAAAPAQKPAAAPVAAAMQSVASVALSPTEQYQAALARYREEKARYIADREIYRAKVADYRVALAQHRSDTAEYRRQVEAARALPHGDPNRLIPPAPTAPVAPVAPVAPTVPPVPPDLDHN